MPRLSKHKKSDTIGMLQAGLRVTDIAQYYNCHGKLPSVNYTGPQRSLPGYWDGKRLTPVWSTKNYNTSSRHYIDSVLCPVASSFFASKSKESKLYRPTLQCSCSYCPSHCQFSGSKYNFSA